jgi:hypothetical protein
MRSLVIKPVKSYDSPELLYYSRVMSAFKTCYELKSFQFFFHSQDYLNLSMFIVACFEAFSEKELECKQVKDFAIRAPYKM